MEENESNEQEPAETESRLAAHDEAVEKTRLEREEADRLATEEAEQERLSSPLVAPLDIESRYQEHLRRVQAGGNR